MEMSHDGLSREERGEVPKDGSFAIDAVLHVKNDEDGPPLARLFQVDSSGSNLKGSLAPTPRSKIDVGVVAVADGLGGAGSQSAIARSGDEDVEKSMAFIGARRVQKVARGFTDEHHDLLATGSIEDVRLALEDALSESPDMIRAKKEPSALHGKIYKDFPSTFAYGFVRETADEKRVCFFWAGDSFLTAYTPDQIYSTYEPGAGDASMDDMIHDGNYGLNAQEIVLPPDTPVLLTAATDGLLKLVKEGEFDYAKLLLLDRVQNNAPDKVASTLVWDYEYLQGKGSVEPDDATLGMVGLMKEGELSKLNAGVPTKTIT